ncbi:MAG: DUF2330 domain-containing protein [Myxococcales bacterium]|nr:DUF2330 domain-containing protein [Myxococcales bacterium]
MPPPPVPGAADAEFAVNQESELIIFEVDPADPVAGEPATVTAHVLIRYAGDPEQFAWLVPVPSVPELELSHAGAFGWLDAQTAPRVFVNEGESRCPHQEYSCRQHPRASCPVPPPPPPPCSVPGGNRGSQPSAAPFGASEQQPTGFSGSQPGIEDNFGAGDPMMAAAPVTPPVQVFARSQIGAYDTVTFGAGDAQAAVDWLQEEGFIVNDTMTPFMQPYLDADMLFIASKLVPGAEADEIRPLRMRYEADGPMIPLQLTAVAAEPHLTVTALIFGDTAFEPVDHPLVTIPRAHIARGLDGRTNYPMALSRVIDEAGGDGFIQEWFGGPPTYAINDPGGCCNADGDFCGIAFNGQCECPMSPVDIDDCSADEELLGTVELLQDLTSRHTFLTRLTTRLSPEEMTFDPAFRAMPGVVAAPGQMGAPLTLSNQTVNIRDCEPDVVDQDALAEVRAIELCAAVYCGEGTCVAAGDTVGCDCDAGTVARVFDDLDGRPSITCVPDVPPVDLTAGGLEIPDVCASSALEQGECVALGGFRATRCPDGMAAIMAGEGSMCAEITAAAGDPGGRNYQAPLAELPICAPAPPDCSAEGWLSRGEVEIQGEECAANLPHDSWLETQPPRTCATDRAIETLPWSERNPRSTLERRPDLLRGLDDEIERFQAEVDEIQEAIAEAAANPDRCTPVEDSGGSSNPRGAAGDNQDGGGLCSATGPGHTGSHTTLLTCLLIALTLITRRRTQTPPT